MWKHFLMMCFLLVSCHGQQEDTNDYQELLNKCAEGVNNIESQLGFVKQYQEKMFLHLEKNMQKDLEKMETKLLTKIESVEKEMKSEMRDQSTTVEQTVRGALTKVVDGQQEVTEWTDTMEKNLLEKLQTQMLQMKDMFKQRFGAFVDHFGNDQSEAVVDRLRDDLANFSRTLSVEVSDRLHSTTNAPNGLIPCNRSEKDIQNLPGCHRLRKEGVTNDGKYPFHLEGPTSAFFAYCDMSDDGGGWTVGCNDFF